MYAIVTLLLGGISLLLSLTEAFPAAILVAGVLLLLSGAAGPVEEYELSIGAFFALLILIAIGWKWERVAWLGQLSTAALGVLQMTTALCVMSKKPDESAICRALMGTF